jgi:hypothetical protein
MNVSSQLVPTPPLSCGVVLRVREDSCDVLLPAGQQATARFATAFPSPRTERVSPGHLVALALPPDGIETVVWRWYDAVVLGDEVDGVRLWEPAHGEVVAAPRPAYAPGRVGARAYLSAGLPGADWWVAGPATGSPSDAEVDLAEVGRLYTEHGLWSSLV